MNPTEGTTSGVSLIFPAHAVTALTALAVGDAFGCPFEFHQSAPEMSVLSITEGRYLSCWDDVHQPVRRCRTSGLYSDDTQQSLVLLWIWNQLVTKGRDPEDAAMVGELFIRICRKMADAAVPRQSSSFGVHRGTGRNFREAILRGKAPDTAGLGGAMRIGPVATLIEDPSTVIPWAVGVTAATTSNAVAQAGAATIAVHAWILSRGEPWNHEFDRDRFGARNTTTAVQEALMWIQECTCILVDEDGGGVEQLLQYAVDSGTLNRTVRSPADGPALTGIPWILGCLHRARSFEDTMLSVCASGGDTDTVSAIAGCLAALRFGADSIPTWMVDGLVGREHILDPTLWHPIASEKPFVEMDLHLQNQIEQQLRKEVPAKVRKKQK